MDRTVVCIRQSPNEDGTRIESENPKRETSAFFSPGGTTFGSSGFQNGISLRGFLWGRRSRRPPRALAASAYWDFSRGSPFFSFFFFAGLGSGAIRPTISTSASSAPSP